MLLADLADCAAAVAATSSRNAKIGALAALLGRLDPSEVPIAIGLLSGEPRQGRIGIGWASVSAVDAPPAHEPTLEIRDLDAALDSIAATTGPGSAAPRAQTLRGLFARATPSEADFVRRLLVGELRQGALEGLVTEAVARAACLPPAAVRRAVMLSGDLGRTAAVALAEGEPGLAAVGLQVGRGVVPMLASTAQDVASAMDGFGEASVEWKIDGIRIQAHRRGDDVRLFKRNLNEISGRLPEIADVVRSLPVREVVLDGEAIAFAADERPHAFQDVMSRVGRRHASGPFMVPFFFDCLHADGHDLIDRPLRERAEHLDLVARGWRIPSEWTDDLGRAGAMLDRALAAGHEGVVVKDLGSVYLAGRRGKAWRKVKPELTLDLVVIGAEWGHGRRRGSLSNLHLGARGPDGRPVMVGKTFKGLTDELLAWQTAALLTRKQREEGITVFVVPELVVEIAIDGVQSSTRYPGGVALRFARVKRYRPDKTAGEADTIETVRALLRRD